MDQATEIIEEMRKRLRNPDVEAWSQHKGVLVELANGLRSMAAFSNDEPFGVSTLRGELADNDEWKADPARPAIIVGTIDMVGSKLLFSGYGDGRYSRPQHAGLIGQDALIVHDEAHLTPAFSDLLRGIDIEQERESRRVRIMELSATQRGNDDFTLQLQVEDEEDERTGGIVKERLDARKRLHLRRGDNVVAGLLAAAKPYIDTNSKILLYVRSPEKAQELVIAIGKQVGESARKRVALLTGTMRGHERDLLVAGNPVYGAFADHAVTPPFSVFLVSTSAGEVGIDIDADHLVCDLTTLDSMIQRLGRVNRRGGERRESRVDVVWSKDEAEPGPKATSLDKALAATLTILERWHNKSTSGVLVSPRNLRTLVEGLSAQEREAGFSPKPTIPPLTDILLDNWSLTSIDTMPGRPEVAAHLHGMTADPPETYVAWRKEIRLFRNLAPHGASSDDAAREARREFEEALSNWFRACRIEAAERLRDTTDRVRTKLGALLNAHRKSDPNVEFPVVLLDERGRATWSRLSRIAAKSEKNVPDLLHYRTVVLPVEAGGLDGHGMLDGKATEPVPNIDVAEGHRKTGRRERCLEVRNPDGQVQYRRLLTDEVITPPAELRERERIPLKELAEGAEDEEEATDLVLLESTTEAALENPETARFQQTLTRHTEAIERHVATIADRLALEGVIKDALVWAARLHDRGKDRPVWQRFARNDTGTEPLAKSEKYLHGRALGGYRHEFGSLLEAMVAKDLTDQAERDLVLHLIAAHHGWARPYFERRAFDHEGPMDLAISQRRAPTTDENERGAVEAMQRFGRLHQRFGRWGLAWLESLLRCADIMASKEVEA